MKRQRAFTLIELLVVIAIIARLAAILFPVFARARDRARQTQSLGYNEYIFRGVEIAGIGNPTFAQLSSFPAGLTAIALIADSALGGWFYDWGNHDGPGLSIEGEHPQWGMNRIKCANGYWGRRGNYGECSYRHTDGGANIVYMDAHAQFMPGKRIRGGVDLPCESPVVDPRKPLCP